MQLLIFDESNSNCEAWMYNSTGTKRITTPTGLSGAFLTNLPDYQCCLIANETASFLPFDAFSLSIDSVFKAIYGEVPAQGFDERYKSLVGVINRVLHLMLVENLISGRKVIPTKSLTDGFDTPGEGIWLRSVRRKFPDGELKGASPVTLRFLGSQVYATLAEAFVPDRELTSLSSAQIPFIYEHTNAINDFYLNQANPYVVEFRLLEPLGDAYWYFPVVEGTVYRMCQPEFALLLKSAFPEVEILQMYVAGVSKQFEATQVLIPFTNLSGWLSKYIANEMLFDRLMRAGDVVSKSLCSLAVAKTMKVALKLERLGFIITSVKAFEINGYADPKDDAALKQRFAELGVFVE
ncbi:hypothetical protein [Shewanella colwelliana]|uniref:hypothetical protein n=1 Tax=Shewanella colwelliana TaxID=23 RepID=UPI0022B02C14|nr:hypothetical protein [Shewanella colwelliana]MCZ4337772.1 hypothetical protein [Shewanella colwelliana]